MLFRDMNFVSISSLKSVEQVIKEASEALTDKTWVISYSEIANVLLATNQVAAEDNISF